YFSLYILFLLFSSLFLLLFSFFFFNAPAPSELYTLSLHDALPISPDASCSRFSPCASSAGGGWCACFRCRASSWSPSCSSSLRRSEEHTSELQSRFDLVCRLLLEKKKKKKN